MKSLIRFVLGLLMPVILIALGGAVAGWGLTNDWQILTWMGLALVAAGIIWGFFLWLWASDGSLL